MANSTTEFSSRPPRDDYQAEDRLQEYSDSHKAALEFIHTLQEDHPDLARELQLANGEDNPSWMEPDRLKTETRDETIAKLKHQPRNTLQTATTGVK